ncbi:MAG TPA: ABC transporter ATP-binding protein [Ilumatobacter sp.]|nr:ABC transporter ATP-binding protein [Ilumatobacter sp.]
MTGLPEQTRPERSDSLRQTGLHVAAVVQQGGFELDVEVSVAPGEVLAVLGPNGSGKSTLLRAIAGLTDLTRGAVVVDGVPLDGPPERRPVGMVFQDYLLFDHMDVTENVAFGLRARGVGRGEARRQVAAVIERVGLSDHAAARPRRLSGGQAQRVALARALATGPRVLLLDEPLAALDAATRRVVRRDLRAHLAGFDGMRVLVTHDPVDAYALADRVAVFDGGRMVQAGTIADVTAHPRSQFVAELIGTNLVAGVSDGMVLRTAEGVVVTAPSAVVGPALATIRPQAITLSRTPPESSARNTWEGVVDDLDRMADRARVGIAGPIHLTAEVTTAAVDALALRAGDPVWSAVKATDIEVYPA